MTTIPLNLHPSVVIQVEIDGDVDFGVANVIAAYVDTDAPKGEQLTYLVSFSSGNPPQLINERSLKVPPQIVDQLPESGTYPD